MFSLFSLFPTFIIFTDFLDTRVLLPSDASPSQCPSGLAKAISPKLLSTIKHGYEHDEPPSHEHIANQELSFHTSVIDMTILASSMYSLGLQINPFASGSVLSTMVRIHDAFSFCLCACGKNPYTENANTSYYPAVLTFSYVRKLVLPPMTPEGIKDINKANKKLLKDMKVAYSAPKENSGTKRKNYAKTAYQKKKRSKV
ncbi:hypothetical protein PHYBLDRAFT_172983 [Phycomyces blakesleeanus NRRL 1555(-)]|uniref:Uncharacterized protein n=1 Tax=Phycomyces blakesleeanus (strain ATCC 8743b / DSM 1359 / FGSC 10004 / NBRC 33097 / NRRL 1555) TaxID=763407 RepID=A0A163D405_PHYB8|nr:hypothetical protein PHYBLDRAFT_172983 [Phycomyces blakesleeanus NRRL 1555(-)]OAD68560.1 hypothetical protein PHYBLDRAFT_172983 [Phycomyces blakesleeanus NRRL 1555(-)]|eukprot:XP_018286600.1 hypothetical protein PHYBLDRAFT_172983 [Phycomyces blakesleeanus NRRL 1555(-)]